MKKGLKRSGVYLPILAVLILAGCEKVDVEKGVPKCVEKSIKDFSKVACSTGAKVDEYNFQNETVYVFNSGTCKTDQSSKVMNSDCNSLGTVGGWSDTVINGKDFSNATYSRTVWEN
ncbi:DUF6970 domain-containing protein [Pontibacter harenae]|uniref:DUF6970 domain-containing protein n=1 Tax=Pontibacter harenae TaxID=2894083 RepID=UPI001E2D8EA8|nr:hypothetical protein [Pontibacter harenae]MCC9167340.1 hypothetical protein [Pontibacter harenae]